MTPPEAGPKATRGPGRGGHTLGELRTLSWTPALLLLTQMCSLLMKGKAPISGVGERGPAPSLCPHARQEHTCAPRQTRRPVERGRLSGGFLCFKIASVLSSHRRSVVINSRRKEVRLLGRKGSAQSPRHARRRSDGAGLFVGTSSPGPEARGTLGPGPCPKRRRWSRRREGGSWSKAPTEVTCG